MLQHVAADLDDMDTLANEAQVSGKAPQLGTTAIQPAAIASIATKQEVSR